MEEFASSEPLADAEKEWIRAARERGVRLTNVTDGGDGAVGFVISECTREKLRQASTGSKQSDETKAKRSASLHAWHLANKIDPDVISRRTITRMAAYKGHSDITKEKIRQAAIRQFENPQNRAAAGAHNIGRKQSEETKTKRAVQLRKYYGPVEDPAAKLAHIAAWKYERVTYGPIEDRAAKTLRLSSLKADRQKANMLTVKGYDQLAEARRARWNKYKYHTKNDEVAA